MNRLLFILHFPPPVHGSSIVGQYIKESDLINTSSRCRYINLGTSASVDEIGKKPAQKILRYLSIIRQVLVQLIRFRPRLCYIAITAKGIGFYKDAVIALMVKLFGVKLVYHFHNKGVSTRQNRWFDNILYNLVFRNTDAILLSKYLYPDIQKYFPENRVHYCPNGIPDVGNEQFVKIKEQSGKTRILFLSNLIESKGVYVLLKACAILKRKNIPFHCTLVGGEGDISTSQIQHKLQKLELTDCIEYVGKKFNDDKVEILSVSDIFVHPTYEDCFPLVLLEAMQNNLPVISTFEGGIPDVVEDGVTGFLVPQKNVEALAQRIELLILNPELRKKMGEAGRRKFEQEFTLNIFENRLKEILNSLA